jgi:hypothetical protein
MPLTFPPWFLSLWVTVLSTFALSVQQPPADTSEAHNDDSVLEGALAIQPLSRNLAGFDTYFKSLGPSHGAINPWFEECLKEYCKRQNSGAHYRLPSLQVSVPPQNRCLPHSSSSILTLHSSTSSSSSSYFFSSFPSSLSPNSFSSSPSPSVPIALQYHQKKNLHLQNYKFNLITSL